MGPRRPPPSHPQNEVAGAKPALESWSLRRTARTNGGDSAAVAEAARGSARGFDQLAQRTDDPVGANAASRREAVAAPIDPHAVQSQPLGSVHVELEVIARHPRLLGRRAERPEDVTIDDLLGLADAELALDQDDVEEAPKVVALDLVALLGG